MITPSWAARAIEYFKVGYDRWPKVYFIGSSFDSPIKIGRSVNVSKRLCSVQNGNPHRLKILATCPEGEIINESTLHQKYRHSRMCGEWFQPGVGMIDVIKKLKNRDRHGVAEIVSGRELNMDWSALCVYAFMKGVDYSDLSDFQKRLTDEDMAEIVFIKHNMPL